MKKVNIFLIILNFNSTKLTLDLVKNIEKIKTNKRLKINTVIVDNNSRDIEELEGLLQDKQDLNFNTCNVLNFYKNIKQYDQVLLKSNQNLGYAAGNNLALRDICNFFPHDYSCILNPDLVMESNPFGELVSIVESDQSIGIAAPMILNRQKEISQNTYKVRKTFKDLFALALGLKLKNKNSNLFKKNKFGSNYLEYSDAVISGCFLFAKNSTWKRIRFFDEKTFLYFEEDILAEKLKLIGKKMVICPNLKIVHILGQSTVLLDKVNLIRFQMNSMIYYLYNYRKNFIMIIPIIKIVYFLRINIINIKEYLK